MNNLTPLELIIKFINDIIRVTLYHLFKIGQHIVMMALLIMTVITLSGNEIDFGEFVGFQFGTSRENFDMGEQATENTTQDIDTQTVQEFSSQTNTGDYRVPYDTYSGGGGLHGLSGWEGVDITGGKGAPLYAPISGTVDKTGVDGFVGPYARNNEQNTWIGISNTEYSTVLLHGDYIIPFGDTVEQGQLIGYENAIGNTTDDNGGPGYHTHWIMYRNGVVFNGLE